MTVGPPSAGTSYTPAIDFSELFGDVKGMRLGVLAGRYGGGELERERGDLDLLELGLRPRLRLRLLNSLSRLRPRLRLR
jgi:hypothetical protein